MFNIDAFTNTKVSYSRYHFIHILEQQLTLPPHPWNRRTIMVAYCAAVCLPIGHYSQEIHSQIITQIMCLVYGAQYVILFHFPLVMLLCLKPKKTEPVTKILTYHHHLSCYGIKWSIFYNKASDNYVWTRDSVESQREKSQNYNAEQFKYFVLLLFIYVLD